MSQKGCEAIRCSELLPRFLDAINEFTPEKGVDMILKMMLFSPCYIRQGGRPKRTKKIWEEDTLRRELGEGGREGGTD